MHFAGGVSASTSAFMLTIIELAISALDDKIILNDCWCALWNFPVDCDTAAVLDNFHSFHGHRLCCDADKKRVGKAGLVARAFDADLEVEVALSIASDLHGVLQILV